MLNLKWRSGVVHLSAGLIGINTWDTAPKNSDMSLMEVGYNRRSVSAEIALM